MKKVLFIIPGLGLGGTNASLENLYSNLKSTVDISIFSLSKYDKTSLRYQFSEVLLPYDRFLYLFDGIFAQMSFIEKFFAFFVKGFKRMLLRVKPDYVDLIYKSRLSKIEKIDGYDTIIAFQEGFTTHFTSLINHQNKIAWIHCNYCSVIPEHQSELHIYERFEKIVCVSDFTANAFRTRYPSLFNNVVTIYNLYDQSRVEGCHVDSSRKEPELIRLISVGRIDKVKRFSLIPKIADSICERGINLKWIIIGGVSNDISEGERMKNAISGMKHKGTVEWLGPKDNPCKYMAESDLYVCLSESEACPMVFIESQLLGLPVLTTDFGSAYEFVRHGYDGIITSVGNIGDVIISLAQNRTELTLLSSNLKEFSYDNDRIIRKIKDIL